MDGVVGVEHVTSCLFCILFGNIATNNPVKFPRILFMPKLETASDEDIDQSINPVKNSKF